jgi:Replication initiator protein, pSAM2
VTTGGVDLHPRAGHESGVVASATLTLREQILARAGRHDYEQWITQVTPVGACTKPVRLRGQLVDVDTRTGEIRRALDTSRELPDGVIYKACGSRKASQCPSCAEVYRRDAFFLLRAGLVGGDGGPDTASRHPCVFATLTAPGFGPVHTRRTRGERVLPCRPRRRRDEICPHGVLLSCPRTHRDDDQVLGKPICLRCFDYTAAVVWNIHAGELWRRTTQALNRALNRLAGGIRVKASFGKVAEFQARGLVHFHVLIRLDRHNLDDLMPPAHLTARYLDDALRQAVADTRFMTTPHPERPHGWLIEWGTQLDIKTIRSGPGGEITDAKVVAYLAKYATKIHRSRRRHQRPHHP